MSIVFPPLLYYSDTKWRHLSKDSLYLSKCLYFDSSAGLRINKAQDRSQTLWDVSYIFWITDLKDFFFSSLKTYNWGLRFHSYTLCSEGRQYHGTCNLPHFRHTNIPNVYLLKIQASQALHFLFICYSLPLVWMNLCFRQLLTAYNALSH